MAKEHYGISGISIGDGITMVPEDELYTVFAPWGWTREQFISLVRALSLPYLVSPLKVKFYWLEAMQFSFVLVLGFNQPDFYAPGAELGEESRYARKYITPAILRDRWKEAINELATIRHFDFSASTPQQTKLVCEKVQERMATWMAQFVKQEHEGCFQKQPPVPSASDMMPCKDATVGRAKRELGAGPKQRTRRRPGATRPKRTKGDQQTEG